MVFWLSRLYSLVTCAYPKLIRAGLPPQIPRCYWDIISSQPRSFPTWSPTSVRHLDRPTTTVAPRQPGVPSPSLADILKKKLALPMTSADTCMPNSDQACPPFPFCTASSLPRKSTCKPPTSNTGTCLWGAPYLHVNFLHRITHTLNLYHRISNLQ